MSQGHETPSAHGFQGLHGCSHQHKRPEQVSNIIFLLADQAVAGLAGQAFGAVPFVAHGALCLDDRVEVDAEFLGSKSGSYSSQYVRATLRTRVGSWASPSSPRDDLLISIECQHPLLPGRKQRLPAGARALSHAGIISSSTDLSH